MQITFVIFWSRRLRRRRGAGAGRHWRRDGVLQGKHPGVSGRNLAAPERDPDVYCGRGERVPAGGLQHLRHPPELRLVQLRSHPQPHCFSAAQLRWLPCQRRPAPQRRRYRFFSVRQHLPVSDVGLIGYLLIILSIHYHFDFSCFLRLCFSIWYIVHYASEDLCDD